MIITAISVLNCSACVRSSSRICVRMGSHWLPLSGCQRFKAAHNFFFCCFLSSYLAMPVSTSDDTGRGMSERLRRAPDLTLRSNAAQASLKAACDSKRSGADVRGAAARFGEADRRSPAGDADRRSPAGARGGERGDRPCPAAGEDDLRSQRSAPTAGLSLRLIPHFSSKAFWRSLLASFNLSLDAARLASLFSANCLSKSRRLISA
mmetsp:Transcript_11253/g.21265  ORF Transcript_11253/g.21265 Transcript_11253/m.21265 type:complete len:207 (-) Transcript_11253:645-1265(-)